MMAFKIAREVMIKESKVFHFSNEAQLSQKAIAAEKKLFRLRDKMLHDDDVLITGNFYEKLPKLLNSPLYDILNIMPKTVIHHIHLTAACNIKYLIKKLCYYDYVYYN